MVPCLPSWPRLAHGRNSNIHPFLDKTKRRHTLRHPSQDDQGCTFDLQAHLLPVKGTHSHFVSPPASKRPVVT